jgi:3-methyladenine DNA glycosylase AlkD
MKNEILDNLKKLSDKDRAKTNAWFFKDYEYLGKRNDKDEFFGVRVPQTRAVVLGFWKKALEEKDNLKENIWQKELVSVVQNLFDSQTHEVRLAGAMLLHAWYLQVIKTNDKDLLKKLFNLYYKNVGWNKGINNWDLVDETARDIAGHFVSEMMTHEERLKWIDQSIASRDLWVNRVVVVATWYQIKKGNEKMCFYVVERSLAYGHDLIHKACGWMLREVGKLCGQKTLSKFIHENIERMPRTCLRYAIERFSPSERKEFLQL